jgi:hypothetical protein
MQLLRPDIVQETDDWRALAWKRLSNNHTREFFKAFVTEQPSKDGNNNWRCSSMTLTAAGQRRVAELGLELGPYGGCAALASLPRKRHRVAAAKPNDPPWLGSSAFESTDLISELRHSPYPLPLIRARIAELDARATDRAGATASLAASLAAILSAQAGVNAADKRERRLAVHFRAALLAAEALPPGTGASGSGIAAAPHSAKEKGALLPPPRRRAACGRALPAPHL